MIICNCLSWYLFSAKTRKTSVAIVMSLLMFSGISKMTCKNVSYVYKDLLFMPVLGMGDAFLWNEESFTMQLLSNFFVFVPSLWYSLAHQGQSTRVQNIQLTIIRMQTFKLQIKSDIVYYIDYRSKHTVNLPKQMADYLFDVWKICCSIQIDHGRFYFSFFCLGLGSLKL